jgi:hypothetical protein
MKCPIWRRSGPYHLGDLIVWVTAYHAFGGEVEASKHPHDTPPQSLMPSPTFADSSTIRRHTSRPKTFTHSSVDGANAKTAIKKAIEDFRITNEQIQRRLVAERIKASALRRFDS